MQESIDIPSKVFSEIKEILNKLSDCQSIDDFLSLKEDTSRLQEYTTFLKINEKYKEVSIGLQDISSDEDEEVQREENNFEEIVAVEKEVVVDEKPVIVDLNLNETSFENSEPEMIEPKFEDPETSEQEILDEKDSESIIKDEKFEENILDKREENNEETTPLISEAEAEKLEIKHQEERKFRLSHIKGVKKMETLFEEEFFGETKTLVEENQTNESITKNNVSLDFMEAEKVKPYFKLDLNDRIAFTKKLFAGSQTDLNEAVGRLNNFQTLDEAKEYLSEIYYDKGWDKQDEFAQRLWNLVESKFQ